MSYDALQTNHPSLSVTDWFGLCDTVITANKTITHNSATQLVAPNPRRVLISFWTGSNTEVFIMPDSSVVSGGAVASIQRGATGFSNQVYFGWNIYRSWVGKAWFANCSAPATLYIFEQILRGG